MKKEIHLHWEEKSNDDEASGTIDLIADKLEQKAILKEVKGNEKILEIGCGDGRNSINIYKNYKDTIIDAFDYSQEMVDLATRNAKKNGINNINFFVNDIEKLDSIKDSYDLIISKRALINLKTYYKQISAIENISKLLNDKGTFLMCENSLNGLKKINEARAALSLPEIKIPWHNKYFDESALEEDINSLTLIKKKHFSSLYYFLSRIVNAYDAMAEGTEPKYDARINRIAQLWDEEFIDDFAQGVLWVWTKRKALGK